MMDFQTNFSYYSDYHKSEYQMNKSEKNNKILKIIISYELMALQPMLSII